MQLFTCDHEQYPYYQFGEWTPDGKWEFWHGSSRFLIHRTFVQLNSLPFGQFVSTDEATQALVNQVHTQVKADLAEQNYARNVGYHVPPTIGAIAYEHWLSFIAREDQSDEAWEKFCIDVKPLILIWINADYEMWAAYALQVSPGEHHAVINPVGNDVQQFDSNAPMLITGKVDMNIGDTGLG